MSALGLPVRRRSPNRRDTNSDADFERLVRETSRALNLTPAEEIELRQRVVAGRRRFDSRTPPSRYEDPALYRTIRVWSEMVNGAVRNNFRPHDFLDKTHVVFGTLPTGEVNALSIPVPSTRGSYLIVFESGFFDFASHMSLAFASTLPVEQREHGFSVLSTDPAAVMENVRQHQELQARFRQIILAYLVEGRFDTLPAAYSDAGDAIHDAVASKLYTAMGLFIMGHEYGHILRGDLEAAGVASVVAGQNIRQIPHAWEQELGADALGIEFAYLAMKGPKHNLAFIIAGADFFLLCYDIIERSANLIATGNAGHAPANRRHPPTSSRRVWIRQVLRAFLRKFRANEVSESDWDAAVKEASNLDQIMERLYTASEPPLKKLHDRGVRLAPSWRGRFAASR